jgi:hypothetical protein
MQWCRRTSQSEGLLEGARGARKFPPALVEGMRFEDHSFHFRVGCRLRARFPMSAEPFMHFSLLYSLIIHVNRKKISS